MIKKFLVVILLLCSSVYSDTTNFGWMLDKQAIAKAEKLLQNNKVDLRKLTTFNDDKDAYNYRFLYEVLKLAGQLTPEELESGRLSSLDQDGVGGCVGYSTTQSLDIVMAGDIIFRGENEEWRVRANPDAIYAIGRYDNLGPWDGSTGAWSVEGLSKRGVLHKLIYGSHDLTNTSPQTGRQWSRVGINKELLEKAAEHKVIQCAHITTIEEAKAALQNGYCLIVCAEASYDSSRDADGFARLNGKKWAHAMAVIAYRGKSSGREGYLIWNSWGDQWINGGLYPNDMPHGSFWVTPENLKFHLDQDDSWAISGYEGFERRIIDWEDVFRFHWKN